MKLGCMLINYNNGTGSKIYNFVKGENGVERTLVNDNFLDICLKSYFNSISSTCPFVVIDDGSTDDSVEIISKYSPGINEFIRKKTNDGLTPGMNEAASLLIDKYGCDIICRFDADIEFISKGWDLHFINYFKNNRKAGALGGCQLVPYGAVWAFGDMLIRPEGYSHILGYNKQLNEGKPTTPLFMFDGLTFGNMECDSVMGCLAAFRSSAFKRVGGLRAEYAQLRGETEDLNLRLLLEGYQCYALGGVIFVHRHIEHGRKNAIYDRNDKISESEKLWMKLWGWDQAKPDLKAIYEKWKGTMLTRNLIQREDGSIEYVGPR